MLVKDLFCVFFSYAVKIVPQRSDQSCQIGRAAGTAKPFLPLYLDVGMPLVFEACLRQYFQGIYIEKAASVQGHSTDGAVIKGFLHHVPVAPVGVQLQHPLGEENKADGSTGFPVDGIVGKVIVKGEGLSVFGGTDTAGDIHSFLCQVIPECFAGIHQRWIAGFPGDISHAAV